MVFVAKKALVCISEINKLALFLCLAATCAPASKMTTELSGLPWSADFLAEIVIILMEVFLLVFPLY